jgi:hypothetical protein
MNRYTFWGSWPDTFLHCIFLVIPPHIQYPSIERLGTTSETVSRDPNRRWKPYQPLLLLTVIPVKADSKHFLLLTVYCLPGSTHATKWPVPNWEQREGWTRQGNLCSGSSCLYTVHVTCCLDEPTVVFPDTSRLQICLNYVPKLKLDLETWVIIIRRYCMNIALGIVVNTVHLGLGLGWILSRKSGCCIKVHSFLGLLFIALHIP